VITLLRHDAEIYRYHVGLPEYSYLTIRKLRAFGKKTKISKWRDLCRTLASQLDEHSSLAKRNRVKLGKSPMQITDFEPLIPHDSPLAGARLMKLLAGRGAAAPKEIIVGHEYATKAGEKKGQSKTGSALEDDDSDDGEDMDDEENEEESDEEDDVADEDNMDDKVGGLDWSDDE
jgi:hypothetical protein